MRSDQKHITPIGQRKLWEITVKVNSSFSRTVINRGLTFACSIFSEEKATDVSFSIQQVSRPLMRRFSLEVTTWTSIEDIDFL